MNLCSWADSQIHFLVWRLTHMDNSHAFKENKYASLKIVSDIEDRFFIFLNFCLFRLFLKRPHTKKYYYIIWYYYFADNLTWLDHDKLTDE